jgi:hypothetical protein
MLRSARVAKFVTHSWVRIPEGLLVFCVREPSLEVSINQPGCVEKLGLGFGGGVPSEISADGLITAQWKPVSRVFFCAAMQEPSYEIYKSLIKFN